MAYLHDIVPLPMPLYSLHVCHSSAATLAAVLRGRISSNLNPFAWQLILTYTRRSSTTSIQNFYIFYIEMEWFRMQTVDAPVGNEYTNIHAWRAQRSHFLIYSHKILRDATGKNETTRRKNKKTKHSKLARHDDDMTSKWIWCVCVRFVALYLRIWSRGIILH